MSSAPIFASKQVQYLRENPKVIKELSDTIWKTVRSGSGGTKVEIGTPPPDDAEPEA